MIVPEPVRHAVEVGMRCALILGDAPIVIAVNRPDRVMFITEDHHHEIAVNDAEWIARRVVEIDRDGIIARHRPGWV